MKKMLVVFLILFSKVLADSEENHYVDLLPNKEKQQFLDKVASRIMEDVDSPENVTDVANVEISDKLLNQHSEYVKTVFKEEQANLRKSRGNVAQEKISSSDEKENLDVKPLKTKRMSEPVDLNSHDSPDKTTTNNTTIENVSNNVTVPNATVQHDNDNKTSESQEATSETLNKETNIANEKSNEEQVTKEKAENSNVTIEAKVLPTNSSEEDTIEKDSMEIEPSDNSDNDKVVLDKSNSGLSESDARNVSVKSINERSRKTAGNLTEDNSTTTAAEFYSSKSAENNSVTYNNESSAEGEVTTLSYAVDGNFTKDSLSISSESTSNESNSIENTTKDAPSETTATATNEDKEIEPLTKSNTLESDSKTRTESPQSRTASDEKSTDFLPKTVPETEIAEETVETTTLPVTVKHTTAIPVDTTKEIKIIVEDFTSVPNPAATVGSTTVTPTIKKLKKKTSPQKVTTESIDSDDDTMEATTKKRVDTIKVSANKKVKHKAIIYKLPKVIVGPKGKKIAEEKRNVENKNFVELKKNYFDNNYKVKVGKEYHVFEIPDGGTPFIKDKEPEAEQPYYVPVYNYSPNNAYFNPLNRLGPNPGDKEHNVHIIENNDDLNFNDDDDDDNYNQQIERTETINVEMEYDKPFDRQRKKFGSKQTLTQGIYRKPAQNEEHTRGKVNPEDYIDSDYYFGRIRNNLARKNDLGNLPNPGGNVPGGTLKDHVKAVRNLLYQHKTFGMLQNDKINRRVRISKDDIDLLEDADDDKNDNHFQKVGYLKEKNNTKELFVMDDVFKANFEKFIQEKVLLPATRQPNLATTTKNSENDEVSEDKNNISNPSVKFDLRRSGVVKVSIYLQVLNDMVTLDNKALVRYDWLGTTVDIQAALQKLFELTTLVGNNENIHPADMEILKYLLFLHNLASEIIEANDFGAQLRKKLRNNKKNKPLLLKEKGLINRLWLYLRKEVPKNDDYNALKHLNEFLMNVEDGLFDLHEAIKHIAMITKYNKQHWYQNLKDLYINLDEKHLLELLLHITTLRLFALIEESAKNGLEDDYIEYMKQNKNHSKNTLQEIMFIMKILDEYKRFVE